MYLKIIVKIKVFRPLRYEIKFSKSIKLDAFLYICSQNYKWDGNNIAFCRRDNGRGYVPASENKQKFADAKEELDNN